MSVAPVIVEPAELTPAELQALFPPGKTPRQPCIIPTLPEAPLRFPTLAHLADELARRLGGKVPVLIRGMATYPGYDTFPIFSVHGINPNAHRDLDLRGRPAPATYVCAVAVQDTPAEDLDRLISAAQVRRMGA